ncbi:MAG: radical SAM protein [Firmicutes bacterium]|nr:radical SAM protein [Bacillota bacterium]
MKILRVRFEPFGGIIATDDPPGLFWVDREFLRRRGFDGGPAWTGDPENHRAALVATAPVEIELALTTRCNLACPCCYTSSGPDGRDVPPRAVARALREAAGLGVFHVAFGGGEPLLHPALLELGRLARRLGVLPSLTTNGTLVTASWAGRAAEVFARVNVSVDVEGGARSPVGPEGRAAWRAVELLRRAGNVTGVNFILTRRSFPRLPELFSRSAEAGAESVLVLRPKPAGRGRLLYPHLRPEPAQLRELVPRLLDLGSRYGLPFHLDCALGPLLLRHPGVDRAALGLLGATGCIAGELLCTVDAEGSLHPCSHLDMTFGRVGSLRRAWLESPVLAALRGRARPDSGPCRECPSADLCRAGCPAVSLGAGRGLGAPDPDLPCTRLTDGDGPTRVVRRRARRSEGGLPVVLRRRRLPGRLVRGQAQTAQR